MLQCSGEHCLHFSVQDPLPGTLVHARSAVHSAFVDAIDSCKIHQIMHLP